MKAHTIRDRFLIFGEQFDKLNYIELVRKQLKKSAQPNMGPSVSTAKKRLLCGTHLGTKRLKKNNNNFPTSLNFFVQDFILGYCWA